MKSSQPKINKLLVPKWKQRTAETHSQHLSQLLSRSSSHPIHVLLLGDSMFERWLTTGGKIFNLENTFNAGVGGDMIQNLLFRTTSAAVDKRVDGGLLEQLDVKLAVVFIGTNNIAKDQPQMIAEGVAVVLQQLRATQKNLQKIILYALPYRTDVPKERIDAYNSLLESMPNIIYSDDLAKAVNFQDHYDDHVHLNEQGYQVWWPILQSQIQPFKT